MKWTKSAFSVLAEAKICDQWSMRFYILRSEFENDGKMKQSFNQAQSAPDPIVWLHTRVATC